MARSFSKNVSNFLSCGVSAFGNVLDGAPAMTVVAQINPASFDPSANHNRLLHWLLSDAISHIFSTSSATATTANIRHQGRGSTSDGANTVAQSTGDLVAVNSWQLAGVVWNFATGNRRLYHNGNQIFDTTLAFAQPTYVQGAVTSIVDRIGGPVSTVTTAPQFAGLIEYLALWRQDILTAGIQALAAGTHPFNLDPAPDILLVLGYQTPDVCLMGSGITTSITGSVPFVEGPTGLPHVAPQITSPLTANGVVGVPFTYTITATGSAPITYEALGLPPGLTVDGAVISGTPTQAIEQAYIVPISATNSAGADNEFLAITIADAPIAPGDDFDDLAAMFAFFRR